jgi:hypothetical protein
MAAVLTVQTGFLAGNLFDGWASDDLADIDQAASAARYAELLGERLGDAFPKAAVNVEYQDGVGALPFSCRTEATTTDEDDAWRDQEDAEARIDQIAADLYQEIGPDTDGAYVWIVKA